MFSGLASNPPFPPLLRPIFNAFIKRLGHLNSPLEIPSNFVLKEQNDKSLPKLRRHRHATRRVVRLVIPHPKITYKQIRRDVQISSSDSTLKRILECAGITNWRAKERPFLHPMWPKGAYGGRTAEWALEQWRLVIWMDECSLGRGRGGQKAWVLRTISKKWDKEMIRPYKKGKDISTIIRAVF